MKYIYNNNQLTNYKHNNTKLRPNEIIRLNGYSLYKKSDKFILRSGEGKVLGEFNDLLSGILTLIKIEKR